jgi:hypothetical protein
LLLLVPTDVSDSEVGLERIFVTGERVFVMMGTGWFASLSELWEKIGRKEKQGMSKGN